MLPLKMRGKVEGKEEKKKQQHGMQHAESARDSLNKSAMGALRVLSANEGWLVAEQRESTAPEFSTEWWIKKCLQSAVCRVLPGLITSVSALASLASANPKTHPFPTPLSTPYPIHLKLPAKILCGYTTSSEIDILGLSFRCHLKVSVMRAKDPKKNYSKLVINWGWIRFQIWRNVTHAYKQL